VPIILCSKCADCTDALCELCYANVPAPSTKPDLEKIYAQNKRAREAAGHTAQADATAKKGKQSAAGTQRLFVGKLPLVVEAAAIKAALAEAAGGEAALVVAVQWIADKATGAFYGSAFVEMANSAAAARAAEQWPKLVAEASKSNQALKKMKVNLSPPRDDETWPPVGGFSHRERPPVM
jgi:hypothetical protein